MKGIFITIEGTEGSGKSLHSNRLSRFLVKEGYKVFRTSEPGKTAIGKVIRRLLLDPAYAPVSDTAELFLYMADRGQHVMEVIAPKLREGYVVICDRFMDATTAYQGYGRRLSIDFIKEANKMATYGIVPDLTVLLDVPLKLGLRRAVKVGPYKGDRIEKEKLTFHKRVRRGYLELAEKDKKRFRIIKVKNNIESTQEQIRDIVINHIGIRKIGRK